MGDRARVQFKDNSGEVSPAAYLHWDGSEAPEYIRECAALMRGRDGDVEYAFARFIGVCHSYIGGNTGLGIQQQATELTAGDSHGDAGCYVVNCETWQVEAFGGYGMPFNARHDC